MNESQVRADECETIAALLDGAADHELQPIKAATQHQARRLRARANAHRDQT